MLFTLPLHKSLHPADPGLHPCSPSGLKLQQVNALLSQHSHQVYTQLVLNETYGWSAAIILRFSVLYWFDSHSPQPKLSFLPKDTNTIFAYYTFIQFENTLQKKKKKKTKLEHAGSDLF